MDSTNNLEESKIDCILIFLVCFSFSHVYQLGKDEFDTGFPFKPTLDPILCSKLFTLTQLSKKFEV